jgi:hypothetical protein
MEPGIRHVPTEEVVRALVENKVLVARFDRLLSAQDHFTGGVDEKAAPAQCGQFDPAYHTLGKALPSSRRG